jgi:hypothetical protein
LGLIGSSSVQPFPRATLPIEIFTVPKRGRRSRSGWKELKKLGEAIYWSAQKLNIWEFAAA